MGFTSEQTLRRSQSAYWCLIFGDGCLWFEAVVLLQLWLLCSCWWLLASCLCASFWGFVFEGIPGFLGAVGGLCVGYWWRVLLGVG